LPPAKAHRADRAGTSESLGREGKAPNALFDHQATDRRIKDLFVHLRQGARWIVRDDVLVDRAAEKITDAVERVPTTPRR
jgi:hypothetical protein